MHVREYGNAGPLVAVLHGGPGAPGYMASLARGLEDSFRVIEPFQRGSGTQRLTVARHVEDLHELVCRWERPPALVGHSWGAMLALAYTATHPSYVTSLVLIACGTFDSAARNRMRAICHARIDDALRRRLETLADDVPDPDERLAVLGNLMLPIYSYQPIVSEFDVVGCDSRAHDETWEDMLRQQHAGNYPSAFTSIQVPVLMLHGTHDPHPGRLILASLRPHLSQVEYREWELCGHYPWLEKTVRADFFAVMRDWLVQRSEGHRPLPDAPPNKALERTRA